MADQWRLQIRIDRGTIGSRDSGVETTKFESTAPLLSLEDCQVAAKQWERHYAWIGYRMTAHAIAPDGTKHHNVHNTNQVTP